MRIPNVMNDLGFLAKKCRRKPTNLSIKPFITQHRILECYRER